MDEKKEPSTKSYSTEKKSSWWVPVALFFVGVGIFRWAHGDFNTSSTNETTPVRQEQTVNVGAKKSENSAPAKEKAPAPIKAESKNQQANNSISKKNPLESKSELDKKSIVPATKDTGVFCPRLDSGKLNKPNVGPYPPGKINNVPYTGDTGKRIQRLQSR